MIRSRVLITLMTTLFSFSVLTATVEQAVVGPQPEKASLLSWAKYGLVPASFLGTYYFASLNEANSYVAVPFAFLTAAVVLKFLSSTPKHQAESTDQETNPTTSIHDNDFSPL